MYAYLFSMLLLLGLIQSAEQWNAMSETQQQSYSIIISEIPI